MNDRRIVAIHQPNFFPWLGFFDKLLQSDVFVLLDSVQYPKKGGSWSNRVKLLVNENARWLTAPVDRNYSGFREIREMRFNECQPWREKMLRTLEVSYGQARNFEEAMVLVGPLVLNPESNIVRYNAYAIRTLAEALGLDASKMRNASELNATGSSTNLLISLTKSAGGTAYMCGGGADGYQEDIAFRKAAVGLEHQNFRHPVYPQLGRIAFVRGLSVVDALMNLGIAGVRRLLVVR